MGLYSLTIRRDRPTPDTIYICFEADNVEIVDTDAVRVSVRDDYEILSMPGTISILRDPTGKIIYQSL